ncbi:hypothetical protein [Phaffia rhodozyma]|uniref:Uncharacterized protein n=1 Tax=Phaffia rhodozyma TaxID=264483 RepID=A0A0F7SPD9_PHARH|nr:hypothetical protein [Phaffia rhodozyma]
MPPIKRIRIAQPKSDPITTGRGWLLSKIDELEASLKDYVIASGLVLRYHADLLQQQQTKNELSAQLAQPPKELLDRLQQNNYAWIRAELDEYLRLAQTPEQAPEDSTLANTDDQINSSSLVPSTASATTSAASTSTAQPVPEPVSRQPIVVKNQLTGEHAISAQPSLGQADPFKPAGQSSTPSLSSTTPSVPAPVPASAPPPLTVAAAVAAASSTNDHINTINDRDNDGKLNPALSFNPQNPHFPRSASTLPGSSMMMTTTEEQPSPVPFVTKPRLKPKPRMKPLLGTMETETEDEMRTSGVGGTRMSSIVDPLLGVVDDSLVQPNMIITPGGGTTRPDGSLASHPSTFFPPPPPSPPLAAPPVPTPATSLTTTPSSLLQPLPTASSSSAQTQMQMQLPIQMQGFPQTLTAAEIDSMTSEQAQAIMDQLNAAVSASASASAPVLPSAPVSVSQSQSQSQSQPQKPSMSIPIPPMDGVIDLTDESDELNMASTAMNTNTNTNVSANADAGAGTINIETGDMTDLSEFLNDVDGENWQQILNQFGQS